jgi:hypothetical protein
MYLRKLATSAEAEGTVTGGETVPFLQNKYLQNII